MLAEYAEGGTIVLFTEHDSEVIGIWRSLFMRECVYEGAGRRGSDYWIFKSPEIKSYTACSELVNFYLN